MKRILALLLCFVMVFALAACSAGDKSNETGAEPDETSSSSKVDGDTSVINVGGSEITFAEFNLHFRTLPMTLASNYMYYYGDQYKEAILQQEGLDLDSSFKDQPCPYYDGSYYDYFVYMTETTCTDFAALCNYASEHGILLDESETADYESNVQQVLDNVSSSGLGIAEYFGDPMGLTTEAVLRSYLLKLNIARKARNALNDSLDFSDEALAAEFESDPKSYSAIDFIAYTISPNGTTVTADDVAGWADKLCEAKDDIEFAEKVKDFHENVLNKDSGTDSGIDVGSLGYRYISYSEGGGDALDWLFNKDTKVFDCYKAFNSEEGTCSVYMLTTPARLNDYTKRNVRHILIRYDLYDNAELCRASAESIYKEYLEDPTEENFAALANRYSGDRATVKDEDGNDIGEPAEKTDGGLYENVSPGDMVWQFDRWLFDEERKPGDSGIVETKFGYHIMYYVGEGEAVTIGTDKIKSTLLQRAISDYEDEAGVDYDGVFVSANLEG